MSRVSFKSAAFATATNVPAGLAIDSLPAVGQLMTFDTMSAEFVGQGALQQNAF
jgi:hypothetical protein